MEYPFLPNLKKRKRPNLKQRQEPRGEGRWVNPSKAEMSKLNGYQSQRKQQQHRNQYQIINGDFQVMKSKFAKFYFYSISQ